VHTVLVVIDVQNDFCSPDGSLAALGFDTSGVQEMVPRLRRLVDAARDAGMPVLFVKTLHDAHTDSPQWLGRVGNGPGTERTGLTCRTGTWGSGFYQLVPGPDEQVVVKNRFSAFVGTNLDMVLRTRGAQSLLFTGVTTETCVESSLREGLFHEYYVSLVEDCAASYSRAAHSASAQAVAQNFGTVVTSEQLFAYWARDNAVAGSNRPAQIP
jgi:nicotinamidase-related amidase